MRRRAPLLLLLAIVVTGGALRAERAADPRAGLHADEVTYVRSAIELADRRTYSQTHYPPGAPALFALAYALGGKRGRDIPAAYWAQALVGTALIVATFALAALIATPWAGVAAAASVGFSRVFIFRTDRLLSEPLAALLLVSAFAALAWALRARQPPARRLAVAGALFGALLLTRAGFLVAPGVVAAALGLVVARRHGLRSALRAVAAFAAPVVLVVAPWCLYASHWEGRFVPVATGGGSSLFVGTYLPGGGSTYGAKRALAPGTPPYRLRAKVVLDRVAARHPGLGRDAALSLEARRNIARYGTHEPAAFARLLLSKPPRLWWRYSEGLKRPNPAAAVALHRALLVVSVLLLGAGLVATRDPVLLAVALLLAAVTAQHTLLLALPRYAVPLLPVLYAGGAAAATLLLERQRSER